MYLNAIGIQGIIKPNSIPLTPEIPLSPLSHKGTGGLISRGCRWFRKTAHKGLQFICNVEDHALNKKTSAHMSGYCPIREISVERQDTRVKRFFVSEAQRAELKNLTEYRRSGTPGDCPGASFWYFLREKVLREFMNLPLFPLVKGTRGKVWMGFEDYKNLETYKKKAEPETRRMGEWAMRRKVIKTDIKTKASLNHFWAVCFKFRYLQKGPPPPPYGGLC
jgi:hypothetical protein